MQAAPTEEIQAQVSQAEEVEHAPAPAQRLLPLISDLDEADKLPISLALVLHLASRLDRSEQRLLMRRLWEMQHPKKDPSEVLSVHHLGEWPEGLTLSRADYYPDEDE